MPRRKGTFNGLAAALAGSFVSRNNDIEGFWAIGVLCKSAQEMGASSVYIDLLSPEAAQPNPLIRFVGETYRAKLMQAMASVGASSTWIADAIITLSFVKYDGTVADPPTAMYDYAFVASVTLADDKGRNYHASASGLCWAHDGWREQRSARARGGPGEPP